MQRRMSGGEHQNQREPDVFNLRSFDLSLGLVLLLSIKSHSPLCIATQITDCYWSEASFLLLIGSQIHVIGTEKIAQDRPTCSILEQYEPWTLDRSEVNPRSSWDYCAVFDPCLSGRGVGTDVTFNSAGGIPMSNSAFYSIFEHARSGSSSGSATQDIRKTSVDA
jgi:hypothetical protein